MGTAVAQHLRSRRRWGRPVIVLVVALIGTGGLGAAAGMGLGAIAAGPEHPHRGYVHIERGDDLPGSGPTGPR